MNALYNILWIDDEHEDLLSFRGQAKSKGVHLVPFKSLNGGMSELERNHAYYDGVLFDARFLENEDDTPGTEDTINVHRAKERLLKLPKEFELFVLTGKAEAFDDETFHKSFLRVYKKGDESQINQLLSDLIQAAKNQPDTQLRQKYHRVFEVCTERYIGENAGIDLLRILKEADGTDIKQDFNALRMIVEDLFMAFHKYNLLPTEFVIPRLKLNPSSNFLAGKEQHEDQLKKYHHNSDTHLPEPVARGVYFALRNSQEGSHINTPVRNHVNSMRTPYLLNSVTFQLMDVLVWFKDYVDSNPKTENWSADDALDHIEEDWLEGQVINHNRQNGYAFLDPGAGIPNIFIPPHLVTNFKLTDGLLVKGVAEEYFDTRDEKHKTRIKKIELLKT